METSRKTINKPVVNRKKIANVSSVKLIIIKEETTPKFIRFLALNKRKGQERREVKRKGKEELTFLDSDPSLLDREFPQVELVNTSRKSRRQLLLATDTNSFFKIKMLKDH